MSDQAFLSLSRLVLLTLVTQSLSLSTVHTFFIKLLWDIPDLVAVVVYMCLVLAIDEVVGKGSLGLGKKWQLSCGIHPMYLCILEKPPG